MFSFKVADKEYKVKFGYKVLCKTDVIDRFVGLDRNSDSEHSFKNLMSVVSELLLAGLQKYHSNEFGWSTEDEKDKAIDKVLDLLDTFEDEGTEENPQDGFTMFEKLQEELFKNGFLSKAMEIGKAEAAKKSKK